MKPTYDEVVEKVAIAFLNNHKFSVGETKDGELIVSMGNCKEATKAAIRAMQDMMPDYKEGKPLLEKLSNEALFYQHFKAMGRDDATED